MSKANPSLDAMLWATEGAVARVQAEPRQVFGRPGDPAKPGLGDTRHPRPTGWPSLSVRLEIHRDLGWLAAEWTGFEKTADCTPFQTFAWLSKWQRHIGARGQTRPVAVTGRDERGELLFIFPLAIEGGRLRRLTWLGSDLCDYNGPLVAERFGRLVDSNRFRQLWGDVLRLLRTDPATRFDLVDLAKMPDMVGGQANPFLALPVSDNPSGAHVATLGPDWEAFYKAKRSSIIRKQERKQFRRLGDHGAVAFVTPREPTEIGSTLRALFEQKARSFARMGVEDIFARPGVRDFFLDAATDGSAGELAQVTRLDIGPTIAATNFGLMFRSSFYLVLSSYHDGELSRFGPGRAHLRETIRYAIGRGCRHFDFTIGDEPYKRDWSDTRLVLHDHLAGVTVRGKLAVAATRAFRAAKRTIKGSPALWRAYTTIRANINRS